MKRERTKISLTLGDDDDKALAVVKAYYGTMSTAGAIRRAIIEHAKQVKPECEERQDSVANIRKEGVKSHERS
jgi:hypothetical protein